MDLYEFNRKDLHGRAAETWESGNHIGTRSDGQHHILLYHLGSFFSEVYYHNDENRIVHVIGFKSKTCLEPYLNQISITELL